MSEGRVRRGWLGVSARTRPIDRRIARAHGLTQETGVEVLEIDPDGPARGAGLRDGDIVIALDGSTVASIDDLHRMLTRWTGGDVAIDRLRGAKRETIAVRPRER
jgi:S1-C subfamily serine protease